VGDVPHQRITRVALCRWANWNAFPAPELRAACRGARLAELNTADLCAPVGVMLERRGQYQLILEKDGNWRFLGAPSGPGGMPLRAFDGEPNGRLDEKIQGYPRRTIVRLSEPAGQRNLPWPVPKRKLGKGSDLDLSRAEVSARRPHHPADAACAADREAPPNGGRSLDAAFSKLRKSGAGEGARTLDPDLGKVVLYH
jgi:hypothetical protein